MKTRTIKLPYSCNGVAHHDDHLFIATLSTLHAFNMASGQDKQLYRDQTGKNTVYRCAVSPDGSQIFITNYTENQLITLNREGTKLSTLTHPVMKEPRAIHVTAQGHVFVSCRSLGNVVQVVGSAGTQTVTTLGGKENGLTESWSVSFNSNTNTLIVGQFENDNIVEFKLK